MRTLRDWMATEAGAAVLLVRLLAGGVFLSEGIQKFLYPLELGTGRFIKIGIPAPDVMAPFVGVVEIVCKVLLISGLLTWLAAVPLIVDITVAIWTTKCMLLGSVFLMLAGAGPWSIDGRLMGRPSSDGARP